MSYYNQQPYRAPAAQPPPAPSSRYFDYAKWQSQQQAAKQQAAKPAASSVVRPQASTSSAVYAPTSYAAAAGGSYGYGTNTASTYASSSAAKPSYVTYNPYASASTQPYATSSSAAAPVSYYGGGSVPYAAPAAAKPPQVSQPVSYASAAKPSTAAYGSSYSAPVSTYGSSSAAYGTAASNAPSKVGQPNTYVIGGAKPQPTPAAAAAIAVPTVTAPVAAADPYASYGKPSVRCAITKAVFIGINYTGQRGLELRGCVNDVANSMQLFKEMGANFVEEQNVRVLTDGPKARRRPTRTEMLAAMSWLTQDCKEGDVLWFHYSGHGSQEKDRTGEEKDGLSESIIPVDYTTNGSIIDNELYTRLVQPLKKGVVLYAIFDCCHSGTILDLRYIFDESTGKLVVDTDYRERRDDEGTVFMLSGCMSTQTSADLPPDARQGLKAQSVGAMTSSYLPLLSQALSWPQFIKSLRTGLKKSRLQQVPQFEMSRPVGLGEVAFRAAFPILGGATGKGAGADEKYVPHEDVAKHCSKHTHKLKKKAEAAAAAAAAAAAGDGADGEAPVDGDEYCDDEDHADDRGIRRSRGIPNGQPNGNGGIRYGNGYGNGVQTSPTRRAAPVYATAAGNPYAAPSLASVARYPGQPQPVAAPSGQRSLPGVGPQAGGVPAVQRGQRRF